MLVFEIGHFHHLTFVCVRLCLWTPKFRLNRTRRTPYWKSFFGNNSAPYCPIKTKIGMRRHNRTHTTVRWWNVKFRKSNMEDGRHFENHYISISQPQLVRISRNLACGHNFYRRRRKRQKKSEIRKFKMAEGRGIKNRLANSAFGHSGTPSPPFPSLCFPSPPSFHFPGAHP